MEGVKVTYCSSGITLMLHENAREIVRNGEPKCICCLLSFTQPFAGFLGSCLSPGDWWDADRRLELTVCG